MEAFVFFLLLWFLKQLYRKKAEFVIPIFMKKPQGNVVEEMSR